MTSGRRRNAACAWTVTTASLAALLLVAAGTALYVQQMREHDLLMISQLDRQIQRDQQELQTQLNQKQVAAENQKQAVVRLVSQERTPPVPASFFGYLGSIVPDDLVLTHCEIARTNDFWSVRLEGHSQPGVNESPAAARDRALTTLTNQLVTGPFHVTIARSEAGLPAAPQNAGAPTEENQLVIEGVIR